MSEPVDIEAIRRELALPEVAELQVQRGRPARTRSHRDTMTTASAFQNIRRDSFRRARSGVVSHG